MTQQSQSQQSYRAKFEAAKQLITEKHYNEARALLRTIDHPTALQWLEKLDTIDPPKVATAQIESQPMPIVVPARKRGSRVSIEIILVLIIVVGGGFWLVRTFTQEVNQVHTYIANELAATATGTLPPVPDKLTQDSADKTTSGVIYKCLGKVYENTGMYSDFQKDIIDESKTDDFNRIGSTSAIYMGDYCSMSEAFQTAWFAYADADKTDLKNNIDRSVAWSRFIVGWEGVNQMYAQQTATMSAYKTANP